jgi:hypothetical protein
MANIYNRLVIIIFPVLLAALPVILHAIDKAFEYKFTPFGKEKLREFMRKDVRVVVSAVGLTRANFNAVDTYFNFEKGCHFVITILIFNIISLFFAQIEFMNSAANFHIVSLILIKGFCTSVR